MIDDNSQIGHVIRDQRNMLQMTGQDSDVVESQAASREDSQPFQHLGANDPVGVGLDIDEMANAHQRPFAG